MKNRAALLGVNGRVALFDSGHPNHNDAPNWFARQKDHGWATSAITINGYVRVLSNPSYSSFRVTPDAVISRLQTFCESPNHRFWPGSVSLLDGELFLHRNIAGHRQVNDAYLLGLAVRHDGKLATLIGRFPSKPSTAARHRTLKWFPPTLHPPEPSLTMEAVAEVRVHVVFPRDISRFPRRAKIAD